MPLDRNRELKAFGRHLAGLRKESGLTQEGLAERSGLHTNYIGDLERGERNPTLMTLLSIARGLRCHPRDLLGFLKN